MAQEFNEEVRCNLGLTVIKQGTTRRTFFSGFDLFLFENDALRLTLAPNGLFFHHPAGHNTVEIDASNSSLILQDTDGERFVLSVARLKELLQAVASLKSQIANLDSQVAFLESRVRALETGNA